MEENRSTAIIDYEIDLSHTELFDLGTKIADLDLQLDQVMAEAKNTAASFKARVNDIQAEMKNHSVCIRTKKKRATGECEVRYDYDAGVVEYALIETGRVVKTRQMSTEEKQLSLFGN